jgi:hypothetical protein
VAVGADCRSVRTSLGDWEAVGLILQLDRFSFVSGVGCVGCVELCRTAGVYMDNLPDFRLERVSRVEGRGQGVERVFARG